MKWLKMFIVLIGISFATQRSVHAAFVKGQNWADRVVEYTSRIQSYGLPGCTEGQLMDPNTEWWILGPPDSDVDGDGDAWTVDESDESIDRDSLAGWKGGGELNKDQEFVVAFDTGLEDYLDDNDLVIRLYSGYKGKASVWASVDGVDYIQLGEIVGQDGGLPGVPGMLADVYFDFEGRFEDTVQYIKLTRMTNGSDTGMFFDAIGSAVVMEPDSYDGGPDSCEQIHRYGWDLESDIVSDCTIDEQDYEAFHESFGLCNDPQDPACAAAFDGLGSAPSSCHGVWQSGLGLSADLNQDCYVDMNDLKILVDQWFEYNESGTCCYRMSAN
ncbi:MAG: hypothetical protein JXM79_25540 [Sedimentisphaerales bacterium]|nr:hypothetical protein [Sedimentisphaerales bacterium]